MKILIATWGEPYFWNKVSYKYKEEREENCSTLSLLRKVLNPDKTILIVSDSLVGRNRKINPNCGVEETLKTLVLNFEGSTYEGIIKFVQNYIEEHLKVFQTTADEIWVVPAGGYYPNAVVKGKLSDTKYTLFWKLFKLSEELLNAKNVEIYLDITHGQNFIPTLTYEVLNIFLKTLAFFVEEVSLIILNADPFISRANPPYLEIHTVLKKKIKPIPYTYYSDRSYFISPITNKTKKYIKNLRVNIENVKKSIPSYGKLKDIVPAFLGAIYNALPLVLFYTYLPPSYIDELLDTAIDIFRKNIFIENKNEKVSIERGLKLDPEFEIFTIYGLFLKGIAEKYTNFNSVNKEDLKVPFSLLEKVTDFLKYNGKNKALLDKELSDLKKLINKYIQVHPNFEWVRLAKIETYFNETNSEKRDLIENESLELPQRNEKRNFLAHSGLNKNAIEIKAENGRVFVRYALSNREINIYEWAREGLVPIK